MKISRRCLEWTEPLLLNYPLSDRARSNNKKDFTWANECYKYCLVNVVERLFPLLNLKLPKITPKWRQKSLPFKRNDESHSTPKDDTKSKASSAKSAVPGQQRKWSTSEKAKDDWNLLFGKVLRRSIRIQVLFRCAQLIFQACNPAAWDVAHDPTKAYERRRMESPRN